MHNGWKLLQDQFYDPQCLKAVTWPNFTMHNGWKLLQDPISQWKLLQHLISQCTMVESCYKTNSMIHNAWKLLQDPIPQWLKAQHKNRQAGSTVVFYCRQSTVSNCSSRKTNKGYLLLLQLVVEPVVESRSRIELPAIASKHCYSANSSSSSTSTKAQRVVASTSRSSKCQQ